MGGTCAWTHIYLIKWLIWIYFFLFFFSGRLGSAPEKGVPDMTSISDIDEIGINRNLKIRYQRDEIYVSFSRKKKTFIEHNYMRRRVETRDTEHIPRLMFFCCSPRIVMQIIALIEINRVEKSFHMWFARSVLTIYLNHAPRTARRANSFCIELDYIGAGTWSAVILRFSCRPLNVKTTHTHTHVRASAPFGLGLGWPFAIFNALWLSSCKWNSVASECDNKKNRFVDKCCICATQNDDDKLLSMRKCRSEKWDVTRTRNPLPDAEYYSQRNVMIVGAVIRRPCITCAYRCRFRGIRIPLMMIQIANE